MSFKLVCWRTFFPLIRCLSSSTAQVEAAALRSGTTLPNRNGFGGVHSAPPVTGQTVASQARIPSMAGGTLPALPPPAAQGLPFMVGREPALRERRSTSPGCPEPAHHPGWPSPQARPAHRHTIPAQRDPFKARASAVCKAPGDSLQSEVCSLKANYEILFRVQLWGAFHFFLHENQLKTQLTCEE